jgi:hypothetical protein
MSQESFPAGIITIMALHAHISPGGWKIRPVVAAVLRPTSLHHNQSIYQGNQIKEGQMDGNDVKWI